MTAKDEKPCDHWWVWEAMSEVHPGYEYCFYCGVLKEDAPPDDEEAA